MRKPRAKTNKFLVLLDFKFMITLSSVMQNFPNSGSLPNIGHRLVFMGHQREKKIAKQF